MSTSSLRKKRAVLKDGLQQKPVSHVFGKLPEFSKEEVIESTVQNSPRTRCSSAPALGRDTVVGKLPDRGIKPASVFDYLRGKSPDRGKTKSPEYIREKSLDFSSTGSPSNYSQGRLPDNVRGKLPDYARRKSPGYDSEKSSDYVKWKLPDHCKKLTESFDNVRVTSSDQERRRSSDHEITAKSIFCHLRGRSPATTRDCTKCHCNGWVRSADVHHIKDSTPTCDCFAYQSLGSHNHIKPVTVFDHNKNHSSRIDWDKWHSSARDLPEKSPACQQRVKTAKSKSSTNFQRSNKPMSVFERIIEKQPKNAHCDRKVKPASNHLSQCVKPSPFSCEEQTARVHNHVCDKSPSYSARATTAFGKSCSVFQDTGTRPLFNRSPPTIDISCDKSPCMHIRQNTRSSLRSKLSCTASPAISDCGTKQTPVSPRDNSHNKPPPSQHSAMLTSRCDSNEITTTNWFHHTRPTSVSDQDTEKSLMSNTNCKRSPVVNLRPKTRPNCRYEFGKHSSTIGSNHMIPIYNSNEKKKSSETPCNDKITLREQQMLTGLSSKLLDEMPFTSIKKPIINHLKEATPVHYKTYDNLSSCLNNMRPVVQFETQDHRIVQHKTDMSVLSAPVIEESNINTNIPNKFFDQNTENKPLSEMETRAVEKNSFNQITESLQSLNLNCQVTKRISRANSVFTPHQPMNGQHRSAKYGRKKISKHNLDLTLPMSSVAPAYSSAFNCMDEAQSQLFKGEIPMVNKKTAQDKLESSNHLTIGTSTAVRQSICQRRKQPTSEVAPLITKQRSCENFTPVILQPEIVVEGDLLQSEIKTMSSDQKRQPITEWTPKNEHPGEHAMSEKPQPLIMGEGDPLFEEMISCDQKQPIFKQVSTKSHLPENATRATGKPKIKVLDETLHGEIMLLEQKIKLIFHLPCEHAMPEKSQHHIVTEGEPSFENILSHDQKQLTSNNASSVEHLSENETPTLSKPENEVLGKPSHGEFISCDMNQTMSKKAYKKQRSCKNVTPIILQSKTEVSGELLHDEIVSFDQNQSLSKKATRKHHIICENVTPSTSQAQIEVQGDPLLEEVVSFDQKQSLSKKATRKHHIICENVTPSTSHAQIEVQGDPLLEEIVLFDQKQSLSKMATRKHHIICENVTPSTSQAQIEVQGDPLLEEIVLYDQKKLLSKKTSTKQHLCENVTPSTPQNKIQTEPSYGEIMLCDQKKSISKKASTKRVTCENKTPTSQAIIIDVLDDLYHGEVVPCDQKNSISKTPSRKHRQCENVTPSTPQAQTVVKGDPLLQEIMLCDQKKSISKKASTKRVTCKSATLSTPQPKIIEVLDDLLHGEVVRCDQKNSISKTPSRKHRQCENVTSSTPQAQTMVKGDPLLQEIMLCDQKKSISKKASTKRVTCKNATPSTPQPKIIEVLDDLLHGEVVPCDQKNLISKTPSRKHRQCENVTPSTPQVQTKVQGDPLLREIMLCDQKKSMSKNASTKQRLGENVTSSTPQTEVQGGLLLREILLHGKKKSISKKASTKQRLCENVTLSPPQLQIEVQGDLLDREIVLHDQKKSFSKKASTKQHVCENVTPRTPQPQIELQSESLHGGIMLCDQKLQMFTSSATKQHPSKNLNSLTPQSKVQVLDAPLPGESVLCDQEKSISKSPSTKHRQWENGTQSTPQSKKGVLGKVNGKIVLHDEQKLISKMAYKKELQCENATPVMPHPPIAVIGESLFHEITPFDHNSTQQIPLARLTKQRTCAEGTETTHQPDTDVMGESSCDGILSSDCDFKEQISEVSLMNGLVRDYVSPTTPQLYIDVQGEQSGDGNGTKATYGRMQSSQLDQAKKVVHFSQGIVFLFERDQGFVSVTEKSGPSLGMAKQHSQIETFPIQDVVEPPSSALPSYNDDGKCGKKPKKVSPSVRSNLLQSARVEIDFSEIQDSENIRLSRQQCGCSCVTSCDKETCECAQLEVVCHVEQPGYPCACAKNQCANPYGREEYTKRGYKTYINKELKKYNTVDSKWIGSRLSIRIPRQGSQGVLKNVNAKREGYGDEKMDTALM